MDYKIDEMKMKHFFQKLCLFKYISHSINKSSITNRVPQWTLLCWNIVVVKRWKFSVWLTMKKNIEISSNMTQFSYVFIRPFQMKSTRNCVDSFRFEWLKQQNLHTTHVHIKICAFASSTMFRYFHYITSIYQALCNLIFWSFKVWSRLRSLKGGNLITQYFAKRNTSTPTLTLTLAMCLYAYICAYMHICIVHICILLQIKASHMSSELKY